MAFQKGSLKNKFGPWKVLEKSLKKGFNFLYEPWSTVKVSLANRQVLNFYFAALFLKYQMKCLQVSERLRWCAKYHYQQWHPVYVIRLKSGGCVSQQSSKSTMLANALIGSDSLPLPSNDWQTNDAFLFAGHSEVVQLLLYSGFDPKQKDRFGQVL